MKYNKVDNTRIDSIMLNNADDNQLLPSTPKQQTKIRENNYIKKYYLPLIILLSFILICLIILIIILKHQHNASRAFKPPTCNKRNNISNNESLINAGCQYFTREEEWDYPHNDMLHTIVNEYDTCCSMCWHQASCTAFAYSPSTQNCWLKTKLDENGGYYHLDRITGYLDQCDQKHNLKDWEYLDDNIFDNAMNGSIPAADWPTCCGLCIRERTCKAYTFSSITHECWLKANAGVGRFNSLTISGRINS
ncbi:unnamed protein product [Adineta steineri]|uniref:Apple domain-containing protein n=2 Tax=Adineta steineri TaxID=433720 RepID=A0A815JAP8_9BILA|nr:unnamed protein product [Adineta steineri]CAF1421093.1 unnamed protein product [Adineta steineri]CAF3728592.1 unnamed protein product [Adineta steineri]CAF3860394.1 unnamed protein product [Adineta steineri]